MIEHFTLEAQGTGTALFCPLLVGDSCGAKVHKPIAAYVFWHPLLAKETMFIYKAWLPVVMGDEPSMMEETVIFLHRFLQNVGEFQATGSLGLIQKCRVRERSFFTNEVDIEDRQNREMRTRSSYRSSRWKRPSRPARSKRGRTSHRGR